MKHRSIFVSILIAFVLSSCGGGGSGSSGSTSKGSGGGPSASSNKVMGMSVPDSWSVYLNKDPLLLSEQQLKDAYWGYALTHYSGKTDLAALSADNVQIILRASKNDDGPHIYLEFPLREAGVEPYNTTLLSSIPSTGKTDSFDSTWDCLQGSVHVKGEMVDGAGTVAIDYNGCDIGNGAKVTGSGAAYGQPVYQSIGDSYSSYFEGSYFYQAVDCPICIPNLGANISGYWDSKSEKNGDTVIAMRHYDYLLLNQTGSDNQILLRLDKLQQSKQMDGVIAVSSIGYTTVSSQGFLPKNVRPGDPMVYQLSFQGLNGSKAYLNYFYWGYVELELDQDGDGNPESGEYFLSESDFMYSDLSQHPLVSASELDHPPVVLDPVIDQYPFRNVDGHVRVDPDSSYFDPDTPSDQLTVNMVWLINGVVQEDLTTATLPVNRLQSGDAIEFYYTVSDAHTTVESNHIQL